MATFHSLLLPLLLLLSFSSHLLAAASDTAATAAAASPFTARASAIRYWDRKVPNNQPHPPFFLSKFSPLSALDFATFSTLVAADPSALSPRLPALCAAARLLCPSKDLPTPSLDAGHRSPSDFTGYQNSNFSNYGTAAPAGLDSFKNYSAGLNQPVDSFRRYSRSSTAHRDSFASYAPGGNLVTANFSSYASSAIGGADEFRSYDTNANVPVLGFDNYDADTNRRHPSFAAYSLNAGAGDQSFSSYGKRSDGVASSFTAYANNTKIVSSDFGNYGEDGNGATDTFTSYGQNSRIPLNTFQSYGSGGTGGTEKFTTYRDSDALGSDHFTSYAKGSNAGAAEFNNYGGPNNIGAEGFTGYGEGANNPKVTFTGYSSIDNIGTNTFKEYAKTGITFKDYRNSTSSAPAAAVTAAAAAKEPAKQWVVEPGKFFRERELRKGTVMPMPDVLDRMVPRAFLPRPIAGKIPFKAGEVRRIFGIPAGTALGKAVGDTVAECERQPSQGETKRCAASAEDVIDFAVGVLGSDVVVRSTESAKGSKGNILIGDVRGVNGGNVTKSVSCHQSLFPYLVYYCHSVPKVRLYEAEILAVNTKEKINQGVAICHLDTSDWSAAHGAFVALGPGPGKIEVCHWIFQGDMTWTVAD